MNKSTSNCSMRYNVCCFFLIPLNCCTFSRLIKAHLFSSKMSPVKKKKKKRKRKRISSKIYCNCGKKNSKGRFSFPAVFSNRSIQLQIWSWLIYYKIEMKERGRQAGWALALKVPSWKMHIHEFFCEVFPIPTQNEAEYLSRLIFSPVRNMILGAKLVQPSLDWCARTSKCIRNLLMESGSPRPLSRLLYHFIIRSSSYSSKRPQHFFFSNCRHFAQRIFCFSFIF